MVPSYRRDVSNMQYYQTAEAIYDELCNIICREFGNKKKIKTYELVIKDLNIPQTDIDIINAILEKNNLTEDAVKVSIGIPKFFTEKDQEFLFDKVNRLIDNIVAVHDLYPNSLLEYILRESYLKKALCCCTQIANQIMRIVRFRKINLNKFSKLFDDMKTIHNEESLESVNQFLIDNCNLNDV